MEGMSGLLDYLEELVTLQEALRRTVSELGSALSRLDQLERLDEVAQRIRRRQAGVVIDREGPLLMRHASAWVVVGPGGIPEDVDVVGEAVALWGQFGEVIQPDLKEYREQGKIVIGGTHFLELEAWLREKIMAGRLTLPYHPASDEIPSRPGECDSYRTGSE